MKLKLGILAGLSLLLLGSTAYADTLDPLHGEVCATSTSCSGTETAGHTDMPTNTTFGFALSPTGTGTLELIVLTPNIDGAETDTLSGSGLAAGGVGLGTSLGVWSTGSLQQFLGISAQPNNPIGSYLPAVQTLLGNTTTLTGFNVYEVADSTSMTLPTETTTLPDEFNLTSALPEGSFVLGYFDENGTEIATADSGALYVDALAVTTPLPATAPLFIGGIGLLGWLTRKGKPQCRA